MFWLTEWKQFIKVKINIFWTCLFALGLTTSQYLVLYTQDKCVLSVMIIAIFLSSVPIAFLIAMIAALFPGMIQEFVAFYRAKQQKTDSIIGKTVFFRCVLLMLILHMTGYLILYYPGCFTTDSNDILNMIMGKLEYTDHFRYSSLNSHHPLVYVLGLKLIIRTALHMGRSLSAGIAAAVFVQILLTAFAIVYLLRTIFMITGSRTVLFLTSVGFIFNPYIARMTITLWKDIPFTAVMLFFVSAAVRTLMVPSEDKKPLKALMVSSCILAFLRSGAIIFPVIFFIALLFLKGINKKKVMISLVCLLCLYLAGSSMMNRIFHPEKGHFAEAIATPLQQVCRVVVSDGNISTDQELFLNQILPLEEIKENYNPVCVNQIKFSKNFSDTFLEENKGQFIKNWFTLGCQNPSIYVKAWIDETKGFWNLGTGTNYYLAYPKYDLQDKNSISEVQDTVRATWDNVQRAFWDFWKPLGNCSFLGWVVCILFFLSIVQKRKKLIVILLPLMANWGIYIVNSPVYQEYRYTYPLYMIIPLLFACFFSTREVMEIAEYNRVFVD